MTHNVKSKPMSLICKRQQRRQRRRVVASRASEKLMANKVLKLLKMEATTKASEAAAASAGTTDAAAGSSQAAVDSGGTVSLDNNSDFYNTGRVGRRNALPDILNHHHSTTSTADLPDKLSALSTTDGSEAGASK